MNFTITPADIIEYMKSEREYDYIFVKNDCYRKAHSPHIKYNEDILIECITKAFNYYSFSVKDIMRWNRNVVRCAVELYENSEYIKKNTERIIEEADLKLKSELPALTDKYNNLINENHKIASNTMSYAKQVATELEELIMYLPASCSNKLKQELITIKNKSKSVCYDLENLITYKTKQNE
jgi:hypothetical protein